MTRLEATPKASICWVAEMYACLGKGLLRAKTVRSSIIDCAAALEPRIVLNAAPSCCCAALYATPVLRRTR